MCTNPNYIVHTLSKLYQTSIDKAYKLVFYIHIYPFHSTCTYSVQFKGLNLWKGIKSKDKHHNLKHILLVWKRSWWARVFAWFYNHKLLCIIWQYLRGLRKWVIYYHLVISLTFFLNIKGKWQNILTESKYKKTWELWSKYRTTSPTNIPHKVLVLFMGQDRI